MKFKKFRKIVSQVLREIKFGNVINCKLHKSRISVSHKNLELDNLKGSNSQVLHCFHVFSQFPLSVEISEFFSHSDFTWNQRWRIWCLKNCHFKTFKRLWIFIFISFCTLLRLKLWKDSSKFEKVAFLEFLGSQKLISRKIWVAEISTLWLDTLGY